MIGVTITKMHVADHGELEARISLGGDTTPVTRQCGSWMLRREGGGVTEVLPSYAAALQAHAREKGFIDRQFQLVSREASNALTR